MPPRNDNKQEPHLNDNKQVPPRNDNKQAPTRNDNRGIIVCVLIVIADYYSVIA